MTTADKQLVTTITKQTTQGYQYQRFLNTVNAVKYRKGIAVALTQLARNIRYSIGLLIYILEIVPTYLRSS